MVVLLVVEGEMVVEERLEGELEEVRVDILSVFRGVGRLLGGFERVDWWFEE